MSGYTTGDPHFPSFWINILHAMFDTKGTFAHCLCIVKHPQGLDMNFNTERNAGTAKTQKLCLPFKNSPGSNLRQDFLASGAFWTVADFKESLDGLR